MAGAEPSPVTRTPQTERSWKKRVSEVCDEYCRDASMTCLRHLRSQQEHPVPIRQSPINSKRTVMKATAKDYCKETSLDGFKYVAEERPKAERILWTVAILASLIGCALPVYEVWHKWVTSPIIVTFADNTESVSTLPFPTVTVCPMVKYRPTLVDFRAALRQKAPLSPDLKAEVDTLRLLCPTSLNNITVDDYINETTIEIMKKVAPHMTNTIECDGINLCEAYYKKVLTEEGVCYSFNALPDREIYSKSVVQEPDEEEQTLPIWTLENGYNTKSLVEEGIRPIRGTAVGYRRAIILILFTNTTEVDLSCRPFRGHRITLSNPAEAPQQQAVHYYLPESGMTQMALTPRVMDTDDDLRRYSVDDRHCVYPDERRLRHFATYTQANCRLECLVNATLEQCGCVQFYMPRENNTPICGLRKVSCATQIEGRILESKDEKGTTCRCPPPCKSIHYSVEITQSFMDIQEVLRAQGRREMMDDYRNMSSNFMVIYFKESEFIASRRSELYGYGSFMAEVGGLLGLWNGFSILSLVELVYFFTIRLWHDTRQPVVEVADQAKVLEEKAVEINGKREPPIEHRLNNNTSTNTIHCH